jgi:hypothetical protein
MHVLAVGLPRVADPAVERHPTVHQGTRARPGPGRRRGTAPSSPGAPTPSDAVLCGLLCAHVNLAGIDVHLLTINIYTAHEFEVLVDLLASWHVGVGVAEMDIEQRRRLLRGAAPLSSYRYSGEDASVY